MTKKVKPSTDVVKQLSKQPLIIVVGIVILAVVLFFAFGGGGGEVTPNGDGGQPPIPQRARAIDLAEQYFETYSGVDVTITRTNRACENAPGRTDCVLWEGRVLKTSEQAEQSEQPEYFIVQVMEFTDKAPDRLTMKSSNELYMYQFTNYNAISITKEIREDTVNDRWDIAVYFPCGDKHWITFLNEDYGTSRTLNLNTMLNYAYSTIDHC